MSQYDPNNPFDDPRPPTPQIGPYRPTSGLAIASLVCGIVFCVPLVTSTLAVAFGVAGLRRTRDGYYSGRGMAIAGVILGVVGVGIWLLVGSIFFLFYDKVTTDQEKAARVADRFVQELGEGKVDAALELAMPGFDRAKASSAAVVFKGGGPFNELTTDVQPILSRRTMELRWELDGDAVFSRSRKPFRMGIVKDKSGEYRVDHFDLY